MARVVWKADEYLADLRKQWIAGLIEIGEEVKRFVQTNTPVLTGYAKASVFYVVLDEKGQQVAGDTVDGNGVRVPSDFGGGTGRMRLIVGANAPYYIWIEIGSRGRAGKAILARANDMITQRIMLKLAEAKGMR